MRLVRGRADARLMPSRHNLAIFRLLAYLRLRSAPPEPRDVILVIDRHQSALETWLVTSWVAGTATAYTAAFLFEEWPLIAALPVAFPLAMVLIELPLYFSGLLVAPIWEAITRSRVDRLRFNSIVILGFFTALSAWHALRPGWVRLIAWQFLGCMVLNALTAAGVFFLRGRIARLESAFGGHESAA